MDTAEGQPSGGDGAAPPQVVDAPADTGAPPPVQPLPPGDTGPEPDLDLPVRGPPPPLEAWALEGSAGEPLDMVLSGDGVTRVLTRTARLLNEVPRDYSVTLHLLTLGPGGARRSEQTFEYLQPYDSPRPGRDWGPDSSWSLLPSEHGVLLTQRSRYGSDLGCGTLRGPRVIRLDETGRCLSQYALSLYPTTPLDILDIAADPAREGCVLAVSTCQGRGGESFPLARWGADGTVLAKEEGAGSPDDGRFIYPAPLADGTTLAVGILPLSGSTGSLARLDEALRPLWEVPLPGGRAIAVAAAPDGTSLTVLRTGPSAEPLRWGATVLPPASKARGLLLRTAPDGTPLSAVELRGSMTSPVWVAWDAEGAVLVRKDTAGNWTLEARGWDARREWSQPLAIPKLASLPVKQLRGLSVHPTAGVRLLVALGPEETWGEPLGYVLLSTPRR